MLETTRVLALPLGHYRDARMQDRLALPGCAERLWPLQEQALAAIEHAGGGFLPIDVGGGKAWIACLAGPAAGVELAIVLTPASTVPQLLRTFFKLRSQYRTVATQIRSVEALQQPTGGCHLTNWVEREGGILDWSKVMLVVDEAHTLKNKTAARTQRFLRAVQQHPAVHVVVMSGTLIQRSLLDCAHLADAALRQGAPMPRGGHELGQWCAGIDTRGDPAQAVDWLGPTLWCWYAGPGVPLPAHRGESLRKAFRKAFRHRLSTAPGVVMSSDEEGLGASLLLRLARKVTVPDVIQRALGELAATGKSPSGDVATDKEAQEADNRLISQGFYYRWVWPDGKTDWDWLKAKRDWDTAVREELLLAADQGYDSPLLVATTVQRRIAAGDHFSDICRLWKAWDAERHKPEPGREAVWLSTYVVDWVVGQVKQAKTTPLLVWYEHLAMGRALGEAGLEVFGAGQEPPIATPRTCCVSTLVHTTGLDLQYGWSDQIMITLPRQAKMAQQWLGRTHRPGQPADVVRATILLHTEQLVETWRKVRHEAQLSQDLGWMQKILIADVVDV